MEVSGSTSKITTNKHKQQKCFSTSDLVRHLVTILSKKRTRTEVNSSMVRHAFTELNTHWHAVNTNAHLPPTEPIQLPHTHVQLLNSKQTKADCKPWRRKRKTHTDQGGRGGLTQTREQEEED